jgi:hypothetical protein
VTDVRRWNISASAAQLALLEEILDGANFKLAIAGEALNLQGQVKAGKIALSLPPPADPPPPPA